MKKLFFLFIFLINLAGNSFAQVLPITGTATVCAGSTTPLSDATAGGTWTSSNVAIATVGSLSGIVTGVAAGIDTITYTVGINSAMKVLTVNPLPVLSSTLTPPAICDSSLFSYVPGSGTPGTTYTWSRAVVAGIINLAAIGTGNPAELLINTTYVPVAVTYVYTLAAGGCTNTENVTVTVNPTPRLSSSLTPPAVCDSTIFNYTPASLTPGTVFNWSRAAIAGIVEPATSGTGNPNEQLINTTNAPISVTYRFTSIISGCSNVEQVTVNVNPTPTLSSTLTPPAICDSSFFNYVPTSATPAATFQWVRPAITGILPVTNFGTGAIHEALYNTTPSAITVTYFFRLSAGSCTNSGVQGVTVTVDTCISLSAGNISISPETIKIYPNPTAGNFTVEAPETNNKTTITVSDILGKVIETRIADGNAGTKEVFNLNNVPPGSYLIKVCTGDRIYRGKVVIW